MKSKRFLFAAVAVLLFFGIVEGVLWLFDVETLVERRDPFQGFSELVRVYEPDPSGETYRTPPRSTAHSFNYQEFAVDKPADGLRVFVIGGSSVFGFPWGAGVAFPALLDRALEASWPDRPIEVVNAGGMSYGSHRLRILVRELLDYDPDVLVIYTGHNEFAERRFYSRLLGRSEELDRTRRVLSSSRIYSLMSRAYEGLQEDSREEAVDAEDTTTGQLLGLDVERDEPASVGPAERAAVLEQFEIGLRDIVREARDAGVTVILCTVPANVVGWAPVESVFGESAGFEVRRQVTELLASARAAAARNETDLAIETLEQARSIAPGHAETHYLLGKAYKERERYDEARAAFHAALNTDGQPIRAFDSVNEILRRLAAELDLTFVDVERIFEHAAPNALVGFNLFEDYVHPNLDGHKLIAHALWQSFQEEGLAGRTGSTDEAIFAAAFDGEGLPTIGDAPGLPTTDLAAANPEMLYNLAVVLEHQGLIDQSIEKYRACLEMRPSYWLARENLARLLFQQGQYPEAARQYRTVLEEWPERVKSLVGLGEALRRMGRLDQALTAIGRAVELDPRSVRVWNSLGGTLIQHSRFGEAEQAFRHAAAIDSQDPETRVNLGLSLLFQKKVDEAERVFRDELDTRPHNLRARNGLAAVMTEQGKLDEAERLFLENLQVDPGNDFARGGLDVIQKRRAGS